MGEVGNIWIKIGADISDFERNMSAAQKAMVKVGDKFQSIGKQLGIIGGAITASMGIIIAKTANLGDQFYDLSQRTGIAVETLSSFKLAADKSGTSIGGFATGMKGLSRAMADAASGGKESKEAFDAVGVSATDSAGNLRPLDQVMLDVADRFAAMENGAEKNALALKLFGKSGMDLIPMLNLGRKGLEENVEQMKKFGIVTTEDARLGDAFNDAMTELQAATGGLTRVIGNALIPAMTSLATQAANIIAKVSTWAREHPTLIKVISGTVLGLGGLLTILGSVSYAIGTVLKHIPTLVNGFKVLVAGLKGIMALASKTIVFTFAIAGAAIVGAAILKMIEDFKKLREAGESTATALQNVFKNLSPFRNLSREGLGKFLTDMEEARNKAIDFKGVMILLGDAFKAIKGVIDPTTSSLTSLAAIFKEFGLKTKTELTAELANAENALKLLKGSAEATPGAIKALEDKIKTLKEGITGITVETKSLAEQLGITFRSDIESRIKKLNEALVTYKGKMTADEVKRIHEEIATLTERLKGLKGPIVDVDKVIQDLLSGLDNTSEEVAKAISDTFHDWFQEIGKDGERLLENDLPAHLRVFLNESKKTADAVANAFDQVTDDMAKAFGEAFANIIRDGLNFANFFKNLMQGIVNTIATFIGKQLSTVLTNLFTKLGQQVGGAFSGFSASANAAAFGIAAGFAAMWVGIGIGMIESKRQWDEYWDEVIEDARRAGKEIVEIISAAMLRASEGGGGGVIDPDKIIYESEWDKALDLIRDAINGVKTATEDLEDAWSKLLSEAKRLGKEGSKELIDLILAFRAAGKESKVLNEYMQSWLNTIPDALSILVAQFKSTIPAAQAIAKRMDEIRQEQERLAIAFKKGTITQNAYKAAMARTNDELDRLSQNLIRLGDQHVKNQKDLDALGRIAVLTFHSMIASGMSWIDAVEAMSPALDALRTKYKELGLEADISLKRLFRIVGITRKHKDLFEQIDATRQILIALGNSAWLTADAWKTLTGQAVNQFHMLRHNGLSVADSLRAMAPTLQAIVNYAATYGLQLDAQTQSLIRQAQQLGVVKDAQKTTGAVLVEGFNRVCDILIKIAEVLGADVSGFMDDITESAGTLSKNTALTKQNMADLKNKSKEPIKNIKTMSDIVDAINTCFGKIFDVLVEIARVLGADISGFMDDIVDKAKEFTKEGGRARDAWEWERDRDGHDKEGRSPGAVNPPRYASGGIAWTPQLARIAEYEPEIVMPLREYHADTISSVGGRNGPVAVNIKPLLIDKKDHYLIEFIQENFDHHVFHVPTPCVGGP